jgi:type I restriction enzyme S subunit
MKSIMVGIPPSKNKTAIATQDDKTAKIDQAIAIKQTNRTAQRTQTTSSIKPLTEASNDKVKLKDSGVEMDWRDSGALEVKKVKYLLKERNERSKDGLETTFL